MAVLYVLTSLLILILNWQQVPTAIGLIIYSAFDPQAALGGVFGYTVLKAIQSGFAGVFSLMNPD